MWSGRKRSLPSGDVGAARGSARPAVGGVSMGALSLDLPSAGKFTLERPCFDDYRPCGLRLRELAPALLAVRSNEAADCGCRSAISRHCH